MLKSEITLTRHALADLMYPVGSYYITESSSLSTVAQMNEFFGGEWIQLDEGRFLEAATSGAGENKAPGLPNIKGTHRTGFYPKNVGGSGAFDSATTNDNGWTGATNQSGIGWANFLASDGELKRDGTYRNDVYGNSDTVQPMSRTVYVYRRSKLGGGLVSNLKRYFAYLLYLRKEDM